MSDASGTSLKDGTPPDGEQSPPGAEPEQEPTPPAEGAPPPPVALMPRVPGSLVMPSSQLVSPPPMPLPAMPAAPHDVLLGATVSSVPGTNGQNRPAEPQGFSRIKGAFCLEEGEGFAGDRFHLRPDPDRAGPIPEDQRRISGGVYAVRNTLKLLHEHGIFKRDETSYHEFVERIKQVARAGCTGSNVDTVLAGTALEAIRTDLVRRRGRPVAYRYLLWLALWALLGVAFGLLLTQLDTIPPGYGWLVIGAMAGAWLSVASSRWEIAFEGLQEFLDVVYEPAVRLLFVALLAVVVGLLLQLQILSLTVGQVNLTQFADQTTSALALGIFAGIGERALSMQVLARAKEVFTIASK